MPFPAAPAAADSAAIHSYGARLLYGIAGTADASMTELGEIISIETPTVKFSMKDITVLRSPDAFREFLAGLGDGGEITVELNHLKAQIDVFEAMYRVKQRIVIIVPDATPSFWDSKAWLQDLGESIPDDDKVTTKVTWKLTGKPTFSPTLPA